jgi:hypothetical protein
VANKATAMANQARMEMLKATQAGSDKGALVNVNA